MYGRAALLTWGLGFILAEFAGIGLAYLAYISGVGEVPSGSIADAVIVIVRFLFLVYMAKKVSVNLANAVCKPLPAKKHSLTLIMLVAFTALLDYCLTVSTSGVYKPQLLGYSYYAECNALWGFPLKIAYYLSEVVVMNYMYILAKKAWKFSKPPMTAGMVFLILGWAVLHAFTKNILVALYAVLLVVIFYTGYEYTGSPITPIILWFTVLMI